MTRTKRRALEMGHVISSEIVRVTELKGAFDSQVAEAKKYHATIPEVELLSGTFKISVKDDNDALVYENKVEPFEYMKVPSLATALQLMGAELDDNQKAFLEQALSGDKTGPAVLKLVEIINADLEETAKRNRYAAVMADHKPRTEENIENANARIVRNYMRNKNLSDETALATLHQFDIVPKEFTLADFRANKSKI